MVSWPNRRTIKSTMAINKNAYETGVGEKIVTRTMDATKSINQSKHFHAKAIYINRWDTKSKRSTPWACDHLPERFPFRNRQHIFNSVGHHQLIMDPKHIRIHILRTRRKKEHRTMWAVRRQQKPSIYVWSIGKCWHWCAFFGAKVAIFRRAFV